MEELFLMLEAVPLERTRWSGAYQCSILFPPGRKLLITSNNSEVSITMLYPDQSFAAEMSINPATRQSGETAITSPLVAVSFSTAQLPPQHALRVVNLWHKLQAGAVEAIAAHIVATCRA